MRRTGFIVGIALCLTSAAVCAALEIDVAAPALKVIRRLPPVEPARPAIVSIDEIAATSQQQLTFEESFGRVLEITKDIPDAPTIGGWIDVGYNSGSTGWLINY